MEVFDQALTSYKSFRFNVAVTERSSGSLRISASSRNVSLYGRMAVCWLGKRGISVASKVTHDHRRRQCWPGCAAGRCEIPRPDRPAPAANPLPSNAEHGQEGARSLLAIMARKTSPRMSPKNFTHTGAAARRKSLPQNYCVRRAGTGEFPKSFPESLRKCAAFLPDTS